MKKTFTVLFIILWVFLAIISPIFLVFDFVQDIMNKQFISPPLYYIILAILAVLYTIFFVGGIFFSRGAKKAKDEKKDAPSSKPKN